MTSDTKRYYKLVRDKIPMIIMETGNTCKSRLAASDEEYALLLRAKLHEEIEEFLETPCAEEAADILQVLMDSCEYHQISWLRVEGARNKKFLARGGFTDRVILEEVVNQPSEDPLVDIHERVIDHQDGV